MLKIIGKRDGKTHKNMVKIVPAFRLISQKTAAICKPLIKPLALRNVPCNLVV
jgi:hypothetical protein